MKTKIFGAILPAAVIAFGIAGAMSTNAMSKKATTLVDVWGYTHIAGQNCLQSATRCTPTGATPCKQSGIQLYDFVSTISCPNPLTTLP